MKRLYLVFIDQCSFTRHFSCSWLNTAMTRSVNIPFQVKNRTRAISKDACGDLHAPTN